MRAFVYHNLNIYLEREAGGEIAAHVIQVERLLPMIFSLLRLNAAEYTFDWPTQISIRMSMLLGFR